MNDRSGTAAILRPSELKPHERSRGARIIPWSRAGLGVSSLSKVCVIAPSIRPGMDVEFARFHGFYSLCVDGDPLIRVGDGSG